MDEIARVVSVISKTIPQDIVLEIKEESIFLRHRLHQDLYVQKYFLPEISLKSFIESLLDEIQVACADMLSEYWPKIENCHLKYEVRLVDGKHEIIFVVPET